MTVTLFISLLVVYSTVVSLLTESTKKFFANAKINYSSNIVVLVLSVIVGVVGTAMVYMSFGIPYTASNTVCLVLMPIAVWVGSMVGYDKVIQMIEQIKIIRK